MAHITSPRLRIVDRVVRKMAPKIRRQLGEMARQQVKSDSGLAQTKSFSQSLGKEIQESLIDSYPEDGFIIDGKTIQEEHGSGAIWHITSLGGLENFSRGDENIYQLFSITINGTPTEVMAYDPITDRVSIAIKGSGAFDLGTRLRVSGRKKLKNGCLYLAADNAESVLDGAIKTEAFLRISGSSIHDILSVCAGRGEAFVSAELSPAETFFGWLMATESGGRATTPTQNNGGFMAANSAVYKELSSLIKL